MSVINETPKIDTIISALSDTQKATLLSILNTNDNAIADYSASIPSTVTGGVTLANCVTPDGLRTGIVFYTGAYQCWFVTYDNRPYCDVYSYDNGKWTAYPRQHLSLLEMRNYLSINSNPEYCQQITTDMLPETLKSAGWSVYFGEVILKGGDLKIILGLTASSPTSVSSLSLNLTGIPKDILDKITPINSTCGDVSNGTFLVSISGGKVSAQSVSAKVEKAPNYLKIVSEQLNAQSGQAYIRYEFTLLI
jgi:hypothetical protein